MKFFFFFVFFLFAVNSFAQGLEMMGAGGPPSQQKAFIKISGENFPMVKSANGSNETRLQRVGGVGSVPYFLNEKDVISVALSSSNVMIDSNARLPADGRRIDARWTSQSLALSFARQEEEGKFWGVGATYGSASDVPFGGNGVDTISTTAAYTITNGETSQWMYLINYSNNRPILNNIPLPGFAYTTTPSKTFRATVGIPFASMKWDYAPDWTLSGSVIGIWKAKVELARALLNPYMQVYTALDFDQQVFIRKERRTDDVRFFSDEKRALLGFRTPLNKTVFIDFWGGRAFGRAVFEVSSYEKRDDNKVELGDTDFFSAAISARF